MNTEFPVAILLTSTNLGIELLRLSQEGVRIKISGLQRSGEGLRFSGPLVVTSTNLAIERLRLSQEDVRISGLLRLGEGLRFSGP